ncbi:hypothetical protein LguiA_031287 [Lonicera macranthoides]
MDHNRQGELDCAFDLESGRTGGKEAGSPEPLSDAKLARTFFVNFYRGFVSLDQRDTGENGASSSGNASNCREVSPLNVKVSIDKKVEGEEGLDIVKKTGKEKSKKTSAKKPPRPPRGLSLDAADQKLIKEIAELAMMKRARAERMKGLKKMKAAKASSSNGNLFAMLFTILFCLAILFQGLSSRTSSVGFHGSPESSAAIEGGFTSVDDHWSPSASDTNLPGSRSPNPAEQRTRG